MATDTLRIHIFETLTTIKQTFADRSVSLAQVAYAYIVVGNKMLGQHIIKRDSGAFLTQFPDVPILLDAQTQRKYIELPGLIFDFDKDDGIEYMAYESTGSKYELPRFSRVKILRTTPAQSEWLMLHPNTAPSPKDPYFYRVNDRIYFLGIEKVPINFIEMGLYLTINPLQKIDIDAPFPFPSELLSDLKRQVMDLIRYSWFFKSDRKNTGADESNDGKTNIPKTVSVNEQQEN
ncbi:MAG TPA: hypothetical protein ACFYEK_01455 [Candidatus Wunengus sp. YC60]|uniref:hypothetical protein n=1 Tax=Candidatus Wunengus sp. YC60 TaxID=3367697 RepID=UPI0040264462